MSVNGWICHPGHSGLSVALSDSRVVIFRPGRLLLNPEPARPELVPAARRVLMRDVLCVGAASGRLGGQLWTRFTTVSVDGE